MQLAARMCFPESDLVTDRFHVVKLVMEAFQHQRIKLRWKAIEKENQAIKQAKEQGVKFITITLENDDTPKQLLARSRYIIAKKQNEWTTNLKRNSKRSNSKLDRENKTIKVKLFRANQRGVVDVKFFLFRMEKLFA